MKAMDCFIDQARGWFRLRAAAIILEAGCVLMAQDVRDPYYYAIGGGVRLQETTDEAVLREAYEETGLNYEIDRLCFIHENFFQESAGRPAHELAFYYLLKPQGHPSLPGHGVSMDGAAEHPVWVPLSQLPRLYAFPLFFRERLARLPERVERITTRETPALRWQLVASSTQNTAFQATDALSDGVICLRCAWRRERDQARGHAPAYRFDILRLAGGEVAGQCELRLGNEEALTWAGNIGYEIAPPFRGQRLAARACRLLFELARAHGMPEVTITCQPGNLASARTAELAGAVYQRTVDIPAGHPMRRDQCAVRVYRMPLA